MKTVTTTHQKKLAKELFEQGISKSKISKRVGKSERTIFRWSNLWKETGNIILQISSRKSKFTESDLNDIEQALLKGAQHYGYDQDLWTLPRIAKLIYETTDKTISPRHASRLIKKIGWSKQKLAKVSTKCDPEKEQNWIKNDFEIIKKNT